MMVDFRGGVDFKPMTNAESGERNGRHQAGSGRVLRLQRVSA